jgi:hypothetical protein
MIFEIRVKSKVYHSGIKQRNKQYPWHEVSLPCIIRILGLQQIDPIVALYILTIRLK